jgi:arsenate reductase (thioredoxin)
VGVGAEPQQLGIVAPAGFDGFVENPASIDQQLALRTASTRLHDHFGVETIERFPHSSYDQFAGRATIPNFLPLLAERWARQRLTALARVEGKITDARPTVLFLCTHNAGRYQMALGYANHLAGDQGVAGSGGSEPGNEINPSAVQAMAEVGIDITREFPKPWTDEIVQAPDVLVTMGCGVPARSSPENATRNGSCPTPPVKVSTLSGPSATTLKNGFAATQRTRRHPRRQLDCDGGAGLSPSGPAVTLRSYPGEIATGTGARPCPDIVSMRSIVGRRRFRKTFSGICS